MLRYLTAGESHGPALTVVVEGLPAGLPVTVEQIGDELARRRLGFGRGPRMRFERDDVELLGGIRHGLTLGSPVSIVIHNTEWPKWQEEMSPAPGATEKPLHQPRPGHADLVGMQKYGFDDARNVLERASARETAARVAAGTLAKLLLAEIGTEVLSHVIQMGPGPRRRGSPADPLPTLPTVERVARALLRQGSGSGDDHRGRGRGEGGRLARRRRGGARLRRACRSRLARPLGPQARRSARAGADEHPGDEGRRDLARTASARSRVCRSDAHDEILWDADAQEYTRGSTLAGGTEGGMTTGGLLVARVAMKPLATLNRPVLKTVDTTTKEETVSFKERTDVTAVPASGVVAETMTALVLANEVTRKFGGDSLDELVRNHAAYIASLR